MAPHDTGDNTFIMTVTLHFFPRLQHLLWQQQRRAQPHACDLRPVPLIRDRNLNQVYVVLVVQHLGVKLTVRSHDQLIQYAARVGAARRRHHVHKLVRWHVAHLPQVLARVRVQYIKAERLYAVRDARLDGGVVLNLAAGCVATRVGDASGRRAVRLSTSVE